MSDCLILVDLQNDYFPGGSMELVGAETAAENARLLLHRFREKGLPVVHIQHISARPGATFFLPGTLGADIHAMVAPEQGEPVVVKNFPNSFRATPLIEMLHNLRVNNLVICGAMSHMCIDATTRAAYDLGFNCSIAEDACATRDLIFKGRTVKAADVHASFMAALSSPFAKVTLVNEIVQNLV
jgi:nicotinamidase-related amidase